MGDGGVGEEMSSTREAFSRALAARGRTVQVLSPFQTGGSGRERDGRSPFQGALVAQVFLFTMTAAQWEKRRLLCASSYSAKTPICAALEESGTG